jgi:hypothetical protein
VPDLRSVPDRPNAVPSPRENQNSGTMLRNSQRQSDFPSLREVRPCWVPLDKEEGVVKNGLKRTFSGRCVGTAWLGSADRGLEFENFTLHHRLGRQFASPTIDSAIADRP